MPVARIALAQFDPTIGDLEGNANLIVDWIARARAAGADIVAFPELAVTGYPPEDLVLRRSFVSDNLRALERVVERTSSITAIVGFVDRDDGHIYNAAGVIHERRLVARYHKHRLPNYGVFDEERYFRHGVHAPVYRIAGANVGVTICEDIWFADGPARDQARAGARLIININGSPYHRGKGTQRQAMLAQRARENRVALCYVNMVGGQDELVFDGQSVVFDADGRLLARACQFDEELLVVDLALPDEPPPPGVLFVSEEASAGSRSAVAARVAAPLDDVAEVWAALVLGVRDYVRKTGFGNIVIGLSGGIDSSLVAAIAVDALGPDHVIGVSMPSRFSSEGSKTDAALLAERLGIRLLTIPIEGPFKATLDALADVFADTEFGVAEENLQARVRGNILMSLSNKFGWLVLTTGNKSELATGYSTLYGDMAGGFAVIKDVPKTLVWELARHRNRVAGVDLIPQRVIDKPPSAELRPDQLDTDSLPPYDVLDPIIEAYVEQDHSIAEIVGAGFDRAVVERVVRMIDRNEYKRRQAPPGIKITPRAFGRDRRLPIAARYHPG